MHLEGDAVTAAGCDASGVNASTLRRATVVDGSIAVAFALVSITLVASVVESPAGRAAGLALALLHSGSLVARRSRPVAVVAVMTLTAALTVPLGLPVVIMGPAIVVGVYTLGLRAPIDVARPVLGAVLVAMAVVVAANNGDAGTVVSNAVVLCVAWWLGDRSRRNDLAAQAAEVAARAAAERAALDERLRIARELHDIVAHSMSVIAVQAGAARYATPADAPEAAAAFAKIEHMSRGALDEMRRLLTVLRDEESAGDRAPSPRLEDLPVLVHATVDAGIPVEVVTTGVRQPLPDGLELCAYRVVQEALTNVRKHARAHHATVRVAYRADELEVQIVDDGLGASAPSANGHGILGMRERVALYGGRFEAAPQTSGGFRVAATFPIGTQP